MAWREIRNLADADELMRNVGSFHDWYLAGFEYDPLARADGQDKSLARFVCETDSLLLRLRYDSPDKSGAWPEAEIEFFGVHAMGYTGCLGSDPFSECVLEEVPSGWAFAEGGALSEEERQDPQGINAEVFVVAERVRWRCTDNVGRKARLGEVDIAVVDITEMSVDAIVNAANEGLRAGGGVCGAIFKAAGHDDLQRACAEIGHCDTGDAVITSGFALDARFVIHAVGPVWSGGGNGEAELLASCYKRSLEIAAENGCKSIAFPLISSGIFGYPKDEAWYVALVACYDWLSETDAQDIAITFCVMSERTKALGEKTLSEIGFPGFN